MKPNDKTYEAARAAILKAMAERNCIIAGVPFNENNYDEFDAGEAVEHSKVALDAAFAAQFHPSEDYAGLIRTLRSGLAYNEKNNRAADALEAVLAERDEWKRQAEICKDSLQETEITLGKYVQENDALKAELAAGNEWIQARAKTLEELAMVRAERDALLARLAPVDDEALVEIAVKKALFVISSAHGNELERWSSAMRSAIAAVRPHIEAAERERCAKIAELHSYPMKTVAGTGYNNAAKEISAAIRSGK